MVVMVVVMVMMARSYPHMKPRDDVIMMVMMVMPEPDLGHLQPARGRAGVSGIVGL